MAILESAAFWIIVAAASELIALSPMKDNSIIQLVLHTLKALKGKKSWTYPAMVTGCLGSIPAVSTAKFKDTSNAKSFMQPYRIS